VRRCKNTGKGDFGKARRLLSPARRALLFPLSPHHGAGDEQIMLLVSEPLSGDFFHISEREMYLATN
jgi:hypothetical protein